MYCDETYHGCVHEEIAAELREGCVEHEYKSKDQEQSRGADLHRSGSQKEQRRDRLESTEQDEVRIMRSPVESLIGRSGAQVEEHQSGCPPLHHEGTNQAEGWHNDLLEG